MGTAELPLEMAVWLPVVQMCVARIQADAAKPRPAVGSVKGGGYG